MRRSTRAWPNAFHNVRLADCADGGQMIKIFPGLLIAGEKIPTSIWVSRDGETVRYHRRLEVVNTHTLSLIAIMVLKYMETFYLILYKTENAYLVIGGSCYGK